MSLTSVNAGLLKTAFISGANNLSNNKEYINELNVFPVPDGDTGTNMTLTIMAAAAEVEAVADLTISNLAKAISSGSLRGARGNSGVILSQIFRGFCKEIKGKDELSLEDVASGFTRSVETAYKAVMKPKEGTILTVARGMAEKAVELLSTEDDIVEYVEKIILYGEEVLAETPEMLPVLKEAGVVDSGGQGLIEVAKGILKGLKGEAVGLVDGAPVQLARGAGVLDDIPKARPKYEMGSGNDSISTADIKFGYCTEFIILLDKELTDKEVEGIKDYLLSIGDSLVCVADEELVKIHVHTNHPGRAFEKGLEYGQLTRCKVDNMREEHSERVLIENEKRKAEEQEAAFKQMKAERSRSASEKKAPAEPAEPAKKYGFVAIASGDGLVDIFTEVGVDYVIHGGQTMNPSTDDILSAVEKVNAENVFILPNNKNIILAANQAKSICEDKEIFVIETKSIPQGISAMLAFNEALEPEDNFHGMKDVIGDVKTGEVTFAIRDTSVDGMQIHKNNIMGITDEGIKAVGEYVKDVTIDVIKEMVDEDSGMISVYYGEDTTEEDAMALKSVLEEQFEDLEVDVRYGGQPIYYYILSVE